jgi:lipopolysaccharide export system protein LptA
MPTNAYTQFCCLISSSSPRLGHALPTAAIRGALLGLLVISTAALGLPEDSDQPIHIRADTAEIDNQEERVIYRGSVQVDQGTLRVTADTMTVEYEDQKVVRITAEGNPAHYKQQIEADEEEVHADALTIIYHTRDERIELVERASLEQEGSTLAGDLIIYDIVEGKVDATAKDDAPVRMTLQPATVEQSSPDPASEH